MPAFRVNDTVKTPMGKGVVQGMSEKGGVLVRIKITDENRKHLADGNCWSPRATISAVWELDVGDVVAV